MTLDRPLRLILAAALVIGLLLVVVALLLLTDTALDVWQRLQQAPRWLVAAWLLLIGTLTLASGFAIFRLLFPRRKPAPADEGLDEDSIQARLERSEAAGIDVSTARRELELLRQRREAGDFRVALFGEISTGKTALIRALLPQANESSDAPEVSVRGGSTRVLTDYSWTSPAGDRLILTDVPGQNEAGGTLDDIARDEALRAHAVVFVCDNDLTRLQYDALSALAEFHKPLVVALNKSDRFSSDELKQLRHRVTEHLQRFEQPLRLVTISAAPQEKVVRILPDGQQSTDVETLTPRVSELQDALQKIMDRDPELTEQLRDASVFVLARRRLDESTAQFRAGRAEELVSSYTRKAVVGALAAVAPGTDVLIQGYLGANFVRELCELYDANTSDIDVKQFLKLSQTHIGRAMPIMMAIGGNALKAFPGAGTVAGGLMHAVAYGLIFDALGRALVRTLSESGTLRPAPAASHFRKLLSENLEKRTASMAKLALDVSRKREQ